MATWSCRLRGVRSAHPVCQCLELDLLTPGKQPSHSTAEMLSKIPAISESIIEFNQCNSFAAAECQFVRTPGFKVVHHHQSVPWLGVLTQVLPLIRHRHRLQIGSGSCRPRKVLVRPSEIISRLMQDWAGRVCQQVHGKNSVKNFLN